MFSNILNIFKILSFRIIKFLKLISMVKSFLISLTVHKFPQSLLLHHAPHKPTVCVVAQAGLKLTILRPQPGYTVTTGVSYHSQLLV